jgi:hypothetical protein
MLSKHISAIFDWAKPWGQNYVSVRPYPLTFYVLYFFHCFLIFSSFYSLLSLLFFFISTYSSLLTVFFSSYSSSSYSSLLIFKLFVVLQTPLALSSICLTQSLYLLSVFLHTLKSAQEYCSNHQMSSPCTNHMARDTRQQVQYFRETIFEMCVVLVRVLAWKKRLCTSPKEVEYKGHQHDVGAQQYA